MNRKFIGVIATASLFAACSQPATQESAKQDILRAHLDTMAKPGDDFFSYTNGTWVKANPIPADEAAYGIGELVQKELYAKLQKINEDALAKGEKSGPGQQIGDFWFSAMDTVSIEKNGIEPLRDELNKIAAMKTKEDVMTQAVHMHAYGATVFFDEGVSQDEKHSDVEAYHMNQGGLGMPERDYYFNTDPRTAKIREAYPQFVATIFKLMGVDSTVVGKKAQAIVALETQLAKASRKLEDLRDPYANYNKYAIAKLKTLSPGIDWPKYLDMAGVKHVDSVIIGQPEFYKELDKVISTTDIQTLKDYMTFHLVATFASDMSKPYADAVFDFYARKIRGTEEQHPRWRRALDAE
jgi:putative endopeptidase